MPCRKIYFSFVAFLAILAVVFSGSKTVQAAFGISPPFINTDHLTKGSRYTQVIYLLQDQPTQDLKIKADLSVPQKIRGWFSVDQGFEFIIPKDVKQFPVRVTVQVPKNVDFGVYRGNLTFTSVPDSSGQVTIALGVQAAINLTIGDKTYEKFTVPVIKVLDIEEGWNPRAYVKFNNEGNISEAFDGATFELFDQYDAVRLAFAQKAKDLPETESFSIKEYTVEFPIDFHLGLGSYWGIASFYQNGKLIASQKMPFNVLKKGSISGYFAQLLNIGKDRWIYGLIGGIMAVAAILVYKKRRRKY